jgi:hypothetical protein
MLALGPGNDKRTKLQALGTVLKYTEASTTTAAGGNVHPRGGLAARGDQGWGSGSSRRWCFRLGSSTGQRGTARDAYRCRGSALSPPADLEGAMEWELI